MALWAVASDTTVPTRKGHPKGLYRLFFIEMWERLAFYTMLGVLLLYATDYERGGLGLDAATGNAIYGSYLAFVYFTPFPGGMLADRFLGYRRAVFIGGVLMAASLLLMSIQGTMFFMTGLVGLVLGNGLFKPNISVMVGNLYDSDDPRRAAGFNIFYMGINIGALISTLVAAPLLRNYFGWLWTFRAAGIGLLIGVVILIFSWKVLDRADRQPERDPDDMGFGSILTKILAPAFITGIVGFFLAKSFLPDAPMSPMDIGFLLGMVPVIVFFVRLPKAAKPDERAGLRTLLPIYLAGGTFFMILHLNGSAMTQWARDTTSRDVAWMPASYKQEALPSYYLNARADVPRPDPRSLAVAGSAKVARMFGQQRLDESSVQTIVDASSGTLEVREFTPEVDVSGLSAVDQKIFTRAVAVYKDGAVTVNEGKDSHGAPTISVDLDPAARLVRRVAFVREIEGGDPIGVYVVDDGLFSKVYKGYEERFGSPPKTLPPGEFVRVVNSEVYQSWNAGFVIVLTPILVAFFGWCMARGRPISTAHKMFYAMCLTTISLLFMALAGYFTDGGASKVSGLWLVGFYILVTTGELMLSPVGLFLVTKLSPKRLAGLAMGGWFLATAFGNKFSGFFGGIQGSMSPTGFFLVLAGAAGAVAVVLRIMLPKLDTTIKRYGG